MTSDQRERFEAHATALGHDLVEWFKREAAATVLPWQASDDETMGAALLELLGRLGIEVALRDTGTVVGVVVHRPRDPWEQAFYSIPCLTALLTALSGPLQAALTPCHCVRCGRAAVPLSGMACDACHLEA